MKVQRLINSLVLAFLLAAQSYQPDNLYAADEGLAGSDGSVSARDLFHHIIADSGYTFEVIGEIPEVLIVPGSYADGDVIEKIRAMLEILGLNAYIIDKNETAKFIRLIISDDEKALAALSPIEDYEGDADLTLEMLRKIKEEHRARQEARLLDTELDPPSDSGLPLTLGQWQQIKEAERKKREELTDDSEILVTDGDEFPMTLGELKNIKQKHRERLESRPESENLTPFVDDTAGLTLGEWRQIKQEHDQMRQLKPLSETMMPPVEGLPDVTLEDRNYVKQIHANQRMVEEVIITPAPMAPDTSSD